jgi:hypothetical protein
LALQLVGIVGRFLTFGGTHCQNRNLCVCPRVVQLHAYMVQLRHRIRRQHMSKVSHVSAGLGRSWARSATADAMETNNNPAKSLAKTVEYAQRRVFIALYCMFSSRQEVITRRVPSTERGKSENAAITSCVFRITVGYRPTVHDLEVIDGLGT